jgi:hypothetical protein
MGFTQISSCLACKYQTIVEVTSCDKHSSLSIYKVYGYKVYCTPPLMVVWQADKCSQDYEPTPTLESSNGLHSDRLLPCM